MTNATIYEVEQALHITPKVFYTAFWGALIIISLLLGFVLNRVFNRWRKNLSNRRGELIFALLESVAIPLTLIAGLYSGMESLPLTPYYERFWSKLILALVILVLTYFSAKVVVLAFTRMSQRDPALERITQPVTFVVRVLFALLATIIFLENLGVSLTAVWTTLGVGSVAIALALQETLSNFFSGIYLLADRPVSPGDYIKLDTNQEGYVVRIGWRATVLRTLGNNYVVIPNATMAKAVITNYSVPQLRMAFGLTVNVAAGIDPARVERALLSVAEEAIHDGLPGLLSDPPPAVTFIPGFADSAWSFTLAINLRQFDDQYPVQSDLRKRIARKFKEAGIEMPFPTRTVVLDPHTLAALAQKNNEASGAR